MMTEAKKRFDRLVSAITKHGPRSIPQTEPERNDQEKRLDALVDWSNQEGCKQFIVFLEFQIENSEMMETENIDKHSALCFHKGKTMALKDLRARFLEWSGQA